MQQLILIAGNGGAGKQTSAQVLYAHLPRASWTHMRWLAALHLWEPTPRFEDLLLRNAASVIGTYLAAGVDQAILSGCVFSQEHADRLLALLNRSLDVRAVWLDLPNELQATRRIGRARDAGDTPESVRDLIATYTFPQPALTFPAGTFCVLDVSKRTPEQIVAEILESL